MTDTTRRALILGTGAAGVAAALAACGGGGSDGAAGGDAGESVTVHASDIPVGGGRVIRDKRIVVTQPTQGEFKAFSAVCTHQGCLVGSVDKGAIICHCHNTLFDIADGSVKEGPAKSPLPARNVTVQGDTVVVG